MVDPLTVYGIGAGINALGSAVASGPKEPGRGNLHLVNPEQQALYRKMFQRLMGGGGDAGFGSAVKTGKGQLQQFFADRGISQGSGVFSAGMADMIANAAGQDSQNRIQMMQNLLRTPLQIAQTSGANFIPGSPSRGPTTEAQTNQFSARRRNPYGDTRGFGA